MPGLMAMLKKLKKNDDDCKILVLGLDNAGKTTILKQLGKEDLSQVRPTQGFNMQLLQHGPYTLNCWDIGGQAQYRSEWGRYTRGCDVIIFVVDSHAIESIPLARKELHRLLEDRELATTPVLVVSNKIDLEPHVTEGDLIRDLNLDYVTENPWIVIPISALKVVNVDQVLQWLIKQGNSKPSS